ncbi:type II and III secretion system protein family protein [Rhodovulum sp. DZ06]|uniref:type II and III secretion system protein family protein n=1 Tax=Rhodovulum sp. DZ06 TaxID=3425126 RepID=UPI003D331238
MTLLRILCVAAAIAATMMSGGAARAQDGVLRMARGAATQDISVETNRAVVLEAIQPFTEVSVANPGIADVGAVSNTSIYILGKQSGRTTLTLLGENGRLIANVTIKVTPDLSELKDLFAQILPGERIETRTAADGLVLSGALSSAGRIQTAMELANRFLPGRVSNMMTVGGSQQVMMKVRFAEVQRSASKSLGFTWSLGFNSGNLTGTAIGGGGVVGNNTGISLGWSTSGFAASVLIEALQSENLARILAEPTLVTLSGDAATFLAGGEFPIPVSSATTNGATTTTVEYKNFGVSLGFTPTVLDDGLINLQLEAESSALDDSAAVTSPNNGIVFRGLSVRRAKTTVELKDGQSFAIAGLLQDDFRDNASKVPWVGDVPVLGSLFRSSGYTSNQTELVLIVSAHIVSPTTADALAAPIDRVKIPNEADLFLFNRLQGSERDMDVAGQNFQGAYGYVME